MAADASGATLALSWQAPCCYRSEKRDVIPGPPRVWMLAEVQRYRKTGWEVWDGAREVRADRGSCHGS